MRSRGRARSSSVTGPTGSATTSGTSIGPCWRGEAIGRSSASTGRARRSAGSWPWTQRIHGDRSAGKRSRPPRPRARPGAGSAPGVLDHTARARQRPGGCGRAAGPRTSSAGSKRPLHGRRRRGPAPGDRGGATGDPHQARWAAGWRGQAGSSSSVTSSMRTGWIATLAGAGAACISAGLRERGVGSGVASIEGAVGWTPSAPRSAIPPTPQPHRATCPAGGVRRGLGAARA